MREDDVRCAIQVGETGYANRFDKIDSVDRGRARRQKMLRGLQGNIPNDTDAQERQIFSSRIDTTKQREMRGTLRNLANDHVTQRLSTIYWTRNASIKLGNREPFVAVFLSATDMRHSAHPPLQSHRYESEVDENGQLGDPPVANWESAFPQIDGMVLLASESPNALRLKTRRYRRIARRCSPQPLSKNKSRSRFQQSNDGMKHFGYVDGRSQPLLLSEDIDRESPGCWYSRWDPEFPLSTALVAEPAATDPLSLEATSSSESLSQMCVALNAGSRKLATSLGLAEKSES